VGAIVKKLRIDLHEEFHCVVNHTMNRPGKISQSRF
jgi:hypothetical protein